VRHGPQWAAMASSAASRSSQRASDRSWQEQAAILLIAWAILLGLVVGIGLLLTHPLENAVDPTDDEMARWFAGQRSSARTQVADLLSLLGETMTVIALAAVVALGVGIWRHSIRPVVFVAVTTGGASAIYILAANAVPRARPPVKVLDPGLDPTQSFPSGHVAAAIALYGLIVVLAWTYASKARWWVTPVLISPLLVAVARLYEGAHHLTDVLTSALFASIWLTVTAMTLVRHQPTGGVAPNTPPNPRKLASGRRWTPHRDTQPITDNR
jgi:membrane-associated phospholipid phosphatase